jgi:glucose/arabinose dehydrogenase
MSTRISSLACLALAACGQGKADQATLAQAEAQQRTQAEDDGRILCAQRDSAFARTCTIDRERRDEGVVLTIRRADGGFRRLLVTNDGRGVVAADGAEPARVRIVDANRIDVALGDDRYRLPATVRGANAAR